MPLHYNLVFDMHPSRVRVISHQTYLYQGTETVSETREIELDSHDINVLSVHMYRAANPLGVAVGSPQVGAHPQAKTRDFAEHVKSFKCPTPLEFVVQTDERKLKVTLPEAVSKGDEVVLKIVSECFPDDRNLEGIYFDYTPEGAPQTMITQCQQYGFQRIVPCVDQMASKTYYTTTIIADTGYSKLITNGDLAPGCFNPTTNEPIYQTPTELVSEKDWELLCAGRPEGGNRHGLKYHNHKVNMAPYLFFLGVGTYDAYQRRLEYPDGSDFVLELLCFPGVVKPEHAAASLSALHESVIWTYLECGPEATLHEQERAEIYQLLTKREGLKEKAARAIGSSMGLVSKLTPSGAMQVALAPLASAEEAQSLSADEAIELKAVRTRLAELMTVFKETGYAYIGQIYREIAMENSNYGGMENVGNTTILSSRLTPSEWLADPGYVYMEGVKVHEYYHNINGSQVTGQSPFEIWLNEAVTVHIQRQREAALFGKDYMRLNQVLYANLPSVGPLAADRSPISMAVEPEGFNTTHELVSAMTYSKAPEFVRLCELILGKERFNRGLENYHQKYAYANATTGQWIDEMAALVPKDADGKPTIDLHFCGKAWLKRTGYPTVHVKNVEYNEAAKTYTISLEQTGFTGHEDKADDYPFPIPLDYALVKGGENINEGLFMMTQASERLVVTGVSSPPDFPSIARGWSFFGNTIHEWATEQTLSLQAMTDPDVINRFSAYRSAADKEKARIISELCAGRSDEQVVVGKAYLDLYRFVLESDSLSMSSKALFLAESESIPTRPDLAHRYQELSDAKTVMLRAAWDTHAAIVLNHFQSALSLGTQKASVEHQHEGLAARLLKDVMLSVMCAGLCHRKQPTGSGGFTTKDLFKHAVALLKESPFMSDKTKGLEVILEHFEGDSQRAVILAETKKLWTVHPIGTETYIRTIGAVDSDDAIALTTQLIEEPFFDMALAGHARSVARGWTSHRKRALLDKEGLKFSVVLFLKIGKVNQMSAYSFLSAFGDLEKFDDGIKQVLLQALRDMQTGLDPNKHESLSKQLAIIMNRKH